VDQQGRRDHDPVEGGFVGAVARCRRTVLAVGVLALGLVVVGGPARAHAPHDDVGDIAVSPDFVEDQTVYVIARNKLMRSVDGGLTWRELAAGFGDETEYVRRVSIAPSDASRLYVGTREHGVYASGDGGETWSLANAGLTDLRVGEIAVSPVDPDLVLAGGLIRGLHRSDDGAATWEPTDEAARVTALSFLPDGSRAFMGRADGRLLSSTDGGVTWNLAESVDGGISSTTTGTGESGDPTVVVGTTAGELLASDDGGETFEPLEAAGLPAEEVRSVTLSPTFADDATVWVSMWDSGPFVSTDGGDTFEVRDSGLTTDEQAVAIEQPQFRDVVIAPDSSVMFLGGFDGLFRSTNEGEDWSSIETLAEYVVGLAVSPAFADDHTVVVMTYVKGAFTSTDEGDSWDFANDGLTVPETGPGNKFAPLRRMHNVVFSPDYAADGTIFSANWVRMHRSTDRGASWEQIEIGPPPEEEGLLRQFVLAVSPQYAADGTIFAATRQGELFRSTQGGDEDTWELRSTLSGRIRSLALSPQFAEDQVLYAGTVEGVYRSDDAGATWQETSVFIEAEANGQETDAAAQVALSPAYGTDGTVFAATDSGLFVSRDHGTTWTEVVSGPLTASSRLEAVAVSPDFVADQLVLASTRDAGLLRSTDGGRTFATSAEELFADDLVIADFSNPTSVPIQFSPSFAADDTIFAYAQTEVLRSRDEGISWERLDLPSGAEVLESLGSGGGQDEAGQDSGSTTASDPQGWFETPIGNLSVKRVLAAVGAAGLVFLAIQLLARGTDVPWARRLGTGAAYGAGAFAVAILVLAA
jgi:photosystem II stability/assembly factor-like uncharacterized protein